MRLFFIIFLSVISALTEANERLANLSIFPDTKDWENVGYDNPNGNVNGEQRTVSSILRHDDIVFDIGADIGGWSKYVLDSQLDVILHVFEPVPKSFQLLQNKLNRPNVYLNNIALGQENGFMDFFVYLGYSGLTDCSSLYYRPIISHALKEKITVEVQSLDYFCKIKDIDHIDFLKVDAEGAEWFIFQGAKELLNNKAISVIQFEYGGCNIDSQTTLKQMYEFLNDNGFKIYRIVPQGLVEIQSWHDSLEIFQYSNYLAVLD